MEQSEGLTCGKELPYTSHNIRSVQHEVWTDRCQAVTTFTTQVGTDNVPVRTSEGLLAIQTENFVAFFSFIGRMNKQCFETGQYEG